MGLLLWGIFYDLPVAEVPPPALRTVDTSTWQ